MRAGRCFLVRSRCLFLRPDLPLPGQPRARPVKFDAQRRDRSHAQPPLGGEHGEDPQFDRAEHGATLRQRRDLLLPSRSVIHQASRMKRSAYSIANWFMASFQWFAALLQSAVILRKANQISLLAASSLGKCPRVLMILRSRALTLSIALVV